MSDDSIAREIAQLRADIKDDFAQLRTELGALLPREVYTAHHDALSRRIDAVERDVAATESARVASRRWVIASVALPVLTMIVTIGLAVWRP